MNAAALNAIPAPVPPPRPRDAPAAEQAPSEAGFGRALDAAGRSADHPSRRERAAEPSAAVTGEEASARRADPEVDGAAGEPAAPEEGSTAGKNAEDAADVQPSDGPTTTAAPIVAPPATVAPPVVGGPAGTPAEQAAQPRAEAPPPADPFAPVDGSRTSPVVAGAEAAPSAESAAQADAAAQPTPRRASAAPAAPVAPQRTRTLQADGPAPEADGPAPAPSQHGAALRPPAAPQPQAVAVREPDTAESPPPIATQAPAGGNGSAPDSATARPAPAPAAAVAPPPADANGGSGAPAPAGAATPEEGRSDEQGNAARIARGLRNAVQQQGGSVTLRLTPPQMGTVRIQLQMTGTTVSASFHAEAGEARSLLSGSMSQLRGALESQGLTVDRLSVQPMGTNAGSASAQQDDETNTDGRSRGRFAEQQRGGDREPGEREPGDPADDEGGGGRRAGAFEQVLDNEVG